MSPSAVPLYHLRPAGDHDALMVLGPGLVGLLCLVIVAVTWLGRRGVIGPLDRPVPRAGALRPVAVSLSAGAGIIHLAVLPDHLQESALVGAFFVATAAFQLGWAVVHLRFAIPALDSAGRAFNAAVIGVWLWSRFVGLPIGPEAGVPEAIGLPDLLATLFEAGLVAILATPLASSARHEESREPLRFADVTIARTFGVLAIAVVTGAAIAELGGLG
jgi:hypothetical protein